MPNMVIPVVAAIIQNSERYGSVLLTKRDDSNHPEITETRYEFPGGKVEKGETLENALLREVIEELGVELQDIDSSHPPRVVHAQINFTRYLVVFMECFCKRPIEDSQLPEFAWVTLDTIVNYNTLPGAVEALRRI